MANVARSTILASSTGRPDGRKQKNQGSREKKRRGQWKKKIDKLKRTGNEYGEKRRQDKLEMEEKKNQEKRARWDENAREKMVSGRDGDT
jgi:hypothetical protein